MPKKMLGWCLLSSMLGSVGFAQIAFGAVPLKFDQRIVTADTKDPDDLCFVRSSKGVGYVVVSDKDAGRVFLFDGAGRQLDAVEIHKPGNIDSRPDVLIAGAKRPLIVVNQREVDPQLRTLTLDETDEGPKLRLLPSKIWTGQNYGGCLWRRKDGQLYFFSTVKGGRAKQIEIKEDNGVLVGKKIKEWDAPVCEGAVADDQAGVVFINEEDVGIRKLQADPRASSRGELILRVGRHGVAGDLEGITILPTSETEGYLIASDQGRSRFIVLDRQAPHRYRGRFKIEDVADTDGVDLTTLSVGERFANGVFGCHSSNGDSNSVTLVSLEKVFNRIRSFRN